MEYNSQNYERLTRVILIHILKTLFGAGCLQIEMIYLHQKINLFYQKKSQNLYQHYHHLEILIRGSKSHFQPLPKMIYQL